MLSIFRLLLAITLNIVSFSTVYSIEPSSDQILKNEQRLWEEADKEKEINQLSKELEQDNFETKKQEVIDKFDNCFNIKSFYVHGNDSISSERINDKVLNKYINKCLAKEKINEIVSEINSLYIREGYLGAQVYLPEQNIKEEKLIIKIQESFIENIKLEQEDSISFLNKPFAKLQIFTAMPIETMFKSSKLKIFNLENATDVFNRLQSNNATIQLKPSQNLGGTEVVIINKPKDKKFFNNDENKFEFLDRTKITANFDNSGLDRVGAWRQSYGLTQDNLLNLNDTLNIYFSGTLNQSSNNSSKAISSNYSVPLGRWLFTFGAIYSNYTTLQNGINRDYGLKGDTVIMNLKTERMMFRGVGYKIGLFNKMTTWSIKNYVENTIVDNNSRNLTTMENGTSGMKIFKNQYFNDILYFNISHVMGLRILNAKEDQDHQLSHNPSAQFHKIRGSLNNYIPFKILNQSFNFNTIISGQCAFNTLYTQEQIALGDRYSVRGFQNQFLISDSGFFVKNDLVYNLPNIKSNHKILSHLNKLIDNVEAFIGYDYGYARMYSGINDILGQTTGSLSGIATGFRFKGKFTNLELTFAKPITYPSQLNPDSFQIYINGGLRF